MPEPGDYRRPPAQQRPEHGPGYTQAAGFGPQNPRMRPPETPPQFQRNSPPRQEGTRPRQPQYVPRQDPQSAFTPGYPQPPRVQYPPPQPAWQQPYQPQQYATGPAPRKKRRVFLWVFLAIQVLFIVLIVTQIAAHPAGPTAAQQAAQTCANHGWYPLFKSQADCNQHYAVALNDAGNVGKGIGVVVIVIIWIVVDFFVGLGYGIYRLASRR
jgi:hypothetical protein